MEDRYKETRETWNKIAQLYEDMFMDLQLYDDTYKRFCDLLPKLNASILEIGCGPGNITRQILDLNPELQILATDVSENMINLTKKNNPKVKTQILDCRNLNALTNRFDGIICGFTIPYLSNTDCKELIYNCSNLLNQDGVFYLSFVSGNYEKSGFISGSSGDRTYFYYHELKQIKQELESNNFIVVDVIRKEYKKSDNKLEIHTIINAIKQTSIIL